MVAYKTRNVKIDWKMIKLCFVEGLWRGDNAK
jgi:hypothetical protein